MRYYTNTEREKAGPRFKRPDQFPTNDLVDKPPLGWEAWVRKTVTPAFDLSKTGERLDQRKRKEPEETFGLDGEPVE